MHRSLALLIPLAPLALTAGCDAKLFEIVISEEATSVVEKGTLIENLIDDFGFSEFTDLNVSGNQKLANQGVEKGDIVDVRLVNFELEATAPDGADLAFVTNLAFFIDAPGLDKVQIASQDAFPEGEARIVMDLDTVDLTEYVIAESLTISADAAGTRPEEDTTVQAQFSLAVGVTGQGIVNQASR